ncbi:hypothetical protein FACS189474_0610 [Bacteroidia bacterium]|nr:hypothetical protein FACS189474_0610 [Bacteroidia bacterium]
MVAICVVFVAVAAVGAVGVPVSAGDAKLAFKLSAVVTNAVVASCVVFVPAPAVGAVGVPVKPGDVNMVALLSLVTLFKASAVLTCATVKSAGAAAAAVLLPLKVLAGIVAKLLLANAGRSVATIALKAGAPAAALGAAINVLAVCDGMVGTGVVTVPVKVGFAEFAFKFNAACVAVDTGLSRSDVLSTFCKASNALVSATVKSLAVAAAAVLLPLKVLAGIAAKVLLVIPGRSAATIVLKAGTPFVALGAAINVFAVCDGMVGTGVVTVPVKVGFAEFAFKSNAVTTAPVVG